MPLSTQIIRDGEPLKLSWTDFHVAAMAMASVLDLPAEQDTLWTDPQGVRDQLNAQGYPDEPTAISPRMSFEMCTYGVLANTPLNSGEVTLTKHHRFVDQMSNELLELQPGDVLKAWR